MTDKSEAQARHFSLPTFIGEQGLTIAIVGLTLTGYSAIYVSAFVGAFGAEAEWFDLSIFQLIACSGTSAFIALFVFAALLFNMFWRGTLLVRYLPLIVVLLLLTAAVFSVAIDGRLKVTWLDALSSTALITGPLIADYSAYRRRKKGLDPEDTVHPAVLQAVEREPGLIFTWTIGAVIGLSMLVAAPSIGYIRAMAALQQAQSSQLPSTILFSDGTRMISFIRNESTAVVEYQLSETHAVTIRKLSVSK